MNQSLQERIQKIEERNQRVEADKAWETSWSRRVLIAGLTYSVIVLFFWVSDLPRPFINAIVPTVGFLISTLSLALCKKFWLARISPPQ